MGVHTGDSITVAPRQTLTDVEYQDARRRHRLPARVGVETGGSNVQFAVDPATGRHGRHRDEPARLAFSRRWPRRPPASRSPRSPPSSPSATRLDEIPNDITASGPEASSSRRRATSSDSTIRSTWALREVPAAFEPVIDYVVTKIPRWAFEKLPGTSGVLGTQMQSVGEAMAIGRTFPESLAEGPALTRGRAVSDSTATVSEPSTRLA